MSLNVGMFLPILPEILLLVLGAVVMVLDLLVPKEQKRNLGWVTMVGAGLVILFSLPAIPAGEPELVWGGMVRHDWLGFTFKMLFLFGLGITALFSMEIKKLGDRGDFYLLLIISTIGMCFMASAADLIMLYLAIETTSIPLYILAGFFTGEEKSTEAGFKYLLFGAMTSTIMLYGFSLLYGFTGTTDIYQIAESFMGGTVPSTAVIGSLLLVLLGFGFKVSAVPLHFWAPDVYEGSPTPVAGFLSTASKAAGFAVLLRVLIVAFSPIDAQWGAILAALSLATMTLGNLIALAQRNIKRLIAYSSIAHAGYALIGVVAASAGLQLGVTSTVFYIMVYLITNLAAFGIITVFSRVVGSDELTAYYGMSRRSPWLALAMLVAFLSLAGMPPFGGFVAKVFVFAAAVQANLIWLAVAGVLNAIIGLYYYLTVLKYVYLYRMEGENEQEHPIPMPRPYQVAMVLLMAGILVTGTIIAPWFGWAGSAAAAMF